MPDLHLNAKRQAISFLLAGTTSSLAFVSSSAWVSLVNCTHTFLIVDLMLLLSVLGLFLFNFRRYRLLSSWSLFMRIITQLALLISVVAIALSKGIVLANGSCSVDVFIGGLLLCVTLHAL